MRRTRACAVCQHCSMPFRVLHGANGAFCTRFCYRAARRGVRWVPPLAIVPAKAPHVVYAAFLPRLPGLIAAGMLGGVIR